MSVTPDQALAILPDGLRADLIGAFNEIVRNFRERRWEPSELNGGKLCEAAFTVVDGLLDGGNYARRAAKPTRFPDACRGLEAKYPKTPANHSARITIPRVLACLYDIRNNRGVGHVGGDVDPNHMDATLVLYTAKWIVAELVRLLHSVTPDVASQLVDDLMEREVVWVWAHGDKKRVLRTGMTWKEQTLVLLLTVPGETAEADLVRWLEHQNPSTYRRDVLKPLHKDRKIEYDVTNSTVRLLPPGVEAAESLAAAA